jgi:cytochrome P450
MAKHDSVIRETLRFEPMADAGLMREIVAHEGIVTPGGLFLPQGTHVAVHVRKMQRDDGTLKGTDLNEFKAFRFCEVEETRISEPLSVEDKGQTARSVPSKTPGAVQINDHHLPFGLGKHAWSVFTISSYSDKPALY